MKRYTPIFIVLVIVALAQLACSMPIASAPTATPIFIITPVVNPAETQAPTSTSPVPVVVTATPNPVQPTATNTPASSNNGGQTGGQTQACTYLATFIADVSIPDDTVLAPGSTFTKTWRVRNDGTCTWGPNNALHALAFTGGSKLNAPDQVSLAGVVAPGKTVDLSVNMSAPSGAGTYVSEWKLRIDGTQGTSYLGLGSGKVSPLFARIIVGPTPTAKPPTATPVSATRINFAAGATFAGVDGQVNAGATRSYVLSAGKNQILMASLTSAISDLRLKIVQKSTGTVLVAVDGASTQATLPADGDYLVQVIGGSQNADFNLGVTIPARITYDEGDSSASVDGTISGHKSVTYLLRALKGQTMTVTVTSPSSAVGITIYGLDDGQPLVRAESGAKTWTGKLPATQDYVIVVVPAVDATTFKLDTQVK